MENPVEITVETLNAYLSDNCTEVGQVSHLEKFATGQSNPTYKMTTDRGAFVLRAKPSGILLKSAHLVEREFKVMQALAATDVAVPEMIHLARDETSPFGRAFFVMEFLEGRIFWDPALPEVDVAKRGAIYSAMNETLARLHEVRVADVGLSDFGKPGDYFARQTNRWARQYRASVVTPDADMDFLIDWLEAHLPEDDGQVALVHGDYRLDNMIFAPDAPVVIGLMDWELSTLGHPLADLAYQCMQWRLPYDAGMRGMGGLARSDLGLPSEEAYVAAYCAKRGINRPHNWEFYLAFSFFRLAAILEGVVRREKDGNASNPETARKYADAIPVLATMAVALIKEG
jgi:aminoglycoside phosphotransferase (APT) family kinase protein